MTDTKIPFTYGLLTAVGAMAWVLAVRLLVTNPSSLVHIPGTPIFFNVLQFVMIYLGLKAKEREYGDKQDFKKGIKTGVAISLVYGVAMSLFFIGVLLIVGTRWMGTEPGVQGNVTSVDIAKAFAGLFISALILGLIYSTLISFFLAKRDSERS
ncbi:MAG TPA: hypothetical protein VFZ22_10130 [Pyrinomonadaceae bacterium]|nr:hypothetical protein [Pyrinomonadaceae bacterium]